MQSDKLHTLEAPAQITAAAPAPRLSRKARRVQEADAAQRHAALLDEYFTTLSRKRSLEDFFQRTTDPELISACIYELNAVQQRYGYILGRLKAEGVTHLRVLRSPAK